MASGIFSVLHSSMNKCIYTIEHGRVMQFHIIPLGIFLQQSKDVKVMIFFFFLLFLLFVSFRSFVHCSVSTLYNQKSNFIGSAIANGIVCIQQVHLTIKQLLQITL